MTAEEHITLAVMAERFRAHADKDEAALDRVEAHMAEHLKNHKDALAHAESVKILAAQSTQASLLAQSSAATAVGNRRKSDRIVLIGAIIGAVALFVEPIIMKLIG